MSARSDRRFLLEIGCEELPDWMIRPALEFLQTQLASLAREQRLGELVIEPPWLGTPRRLAVLACGLVERQPDRMVEATGPRVDAAYDAAGKPTRALEGFARSQHVAPGELHRVTTPKGEFMAARRVEKGRAAVEVLSGAIPEIVARIPFGKTMRWGEGGFRFARPIQWLVCLFGEEIVPFAIAGIATGRRSRGPRFTGSPTLEISDAGDYLQVLERGEVMVDAVRRRKRIEEDILKECAALGGELRPEDRPALLDTLAGLVEWPQAAAGGFDASFLTLPSEVLSTAMIHHQRFIPLRQQEGAQAPHYVAILNCRNEPAVLRTIRRGNEWVLRARLRDAVFFWEEDLKRSLEQRLPELDKVLFEATLGSYRRKVDRTARLAETLCSDIEGRGMRLERAAVVRAARLGKSDLTTLMVKEFPELQGVMGGLYARHEGESETVIRAISEQYLGAGEADHRQRFSCPESAALAMADRMDTLAGFFLLDRVPSGSRDPLGLRRSALALIQACLDQQMHCSLSRLQSAALALYADQGVTPRGAGVQRLEGFIQERIRHVCQEAMGLRYDAVNAALAVGADDPLATVRRAEALHRIRGLDDFEALSLSTRRVRNILAEQTVEPLGETSLPTQEERALLRALQATESKAGPLLDRGEYFEALKILATLRPALDRFFDKVLVMDADPAIRANRLALLKRVRVLLLRVGDFAEMVLEGEAVGSGAGSGKHA